jgi:hypothetical protein
VIRIDAAQRRIRLGRRHLLAPGTAAGTPEQVAAALVAMHATDPATVFLAVAARTAGVGADAVEKALYDDRTLLRMLGMRRTMFVVPTATGPVVQASSSDAVAAQQRRRFVQIFSDAGLGDGAWLAALEESTVEALGRRGAATGAQLSADVPLLRSTVTRNEGKAYGGPVGITTWVLNLVALEGRIVRGRPRGSWISTQWSWSSVQAWLPDGLAALAAAPARVELVRQWLTAFGPGTFTDLKWWTGWTAGQLRPALEALKPVEVDLGGATGLMLPDDPADADGSDAAPWVALLPALDSTPMGWAERDWYVGPHATVLFDRNGNIGPTVWCDGRIVGGWAQRRDGEIVYRLLEEVGTDAEAAVAAQAERLTQWIGPVRVTPRFRTPLERELTG